MNLPERFGLDYVDEQGQRQRPVMLHRALFGSLERFLGILIEHHAGKLPAWLAPQQAVVMSITEPQAGYANTLAETLCGAEIRAKADVRNEKIGYKIREQTLQRIPFLLIVGSREAAEGKVTLRHRDGTDLGTLPVDEAITLLAEHSRAPDIDVQRREQANRLERLRAPTPAEETPA